MRAREPDADGYAERNGDPGAVGHVAARIAEML
jgi:hypothetical protein